MSRIVTPEEAQAKQEAATEGPWTAVITGGWSHENYVCRPDDLGVAMQYALVWQPGDAALIAIAPDLAYTVEQQGRQIAAVKALHHPRSIDLINAAECVDEECDHDECPTEPGQVCDHCFGMFERHSGEYAYEHISKDALYPCPTARALGVES